MLVEQERQGLVRSATTRQRVTSWAVSLLGRPAPLPTPPHTAALSSLAVAEEEGRYLLAGQTDGAILLHDLGGPGGAGLGAELQSPTLNIPRSSRYAHSKAVSTVSWGSDTGLFLSSGRDGVVRVWDTERGRPAEQFQLAGSLLQHSLQPGHTLVAVAEDSQQVRLVDLRTGSTVHQLRGHTGRLGCLAWSSGGHTSILASGAADCRLLLWDVRQARSCIRQLDYNDVRYKRESELQLAGKAHQGPVLGVGWSPCGRYILSLGADRRVRKWDAITGKNLKAKYDEVDTVGLRTGLTLAFSRAGATDCLFLPAKTRVAVLEVDNGRTARQLPAAHFGPVAALAYSPARLQLYTGGRDRQILAWQPDSDTGARQQEALPALTDNSRPNVLTRDSWSSDSDQD